MIYLDDNGITIKAKPGAKGAKAGETYELNGKKYYVALDNWDLKMLMRKGADMSKVVTSKITTMNSLFSYKDFNQDISSWDTSKVKSMTGMFWGCEFFNQPIGSWNTANVTAMLDMFHDAKAFNQPIGDWDTSSVRNISNMFENAESFNQNINDWDASKFDGMLATFRGAISFNQPLDKWNISKYARMFSLFENAKSFNQDISNWKVNGSLVSFFSGAESFNQPLNWDVSRVDSMKSLFNGAKSFNQDISSWNMSGVYSTENMFFGASSFNKNIGDWNMGKVKNMQNMFREASSFNQDIARWDVSSVEKMTGLFQDATSFNQDIRHWKLNSSLKKSRTMFQNAKSFNEEFNPLNNIEKPKKVDTGIKLIPEDKKAISKIKKLLTARDFDKIDLGLELLISLNNLELFETLLYGCKIGSFLTRNKFFTGTEPAQRYLDYVLINIIANAPQESKIDDSLLLKNITSLDVNMFFLFNDPFFYYSHNKIHKFLPIHNFSSLTYLSINLGLFDLKDAFYLPKNKSQVKHKNPADIEDMFPESITDLTLKRPNGSLKFFKNFKRLKTLQFDTDSDWSIHDCESFKYLENLEELKFRSSKFENLEFLAECKKLKKLDLSISYEYSSYSVDVKLENIDFLNKLQELEELKISNLDKFINLGYLLLSKTLKKLSLSLYSDANIEFLLSCKHIKKLSLALEDDIDLKVLKNCESLETLDLSGYSKLHLYGKISDIDGLKGLNNLKTLSINQKNKNSIKISGLGDGNLMTELNTSTTRYSKFDEHKNNIKKDEEFIPFPGFEFQDCDDPKNKRDYIAKGITRPKLNSDDRKAFSEIKKLLNIRDYNKIDEAIEKLVSLNNIELFEILLDGCEIYYNRSSNLLAYKKKLIKNKFFTGSRLAQPYLDYALFHIIAHSPQRAEIHNSLVKKNISSLDINIFLWNNGYLCLHIPLDKFSSLSSLKIDFQNFRDFRGNKNIKREDWFINNNIIELDLSNIGGSLKWFKNLRQLKSLKFRFGYDRIEFIESFEYLEDLEELHLDYINSFQVFKNIDFLKKCKRIKKLRLNIASNSNNVEFENIDVIKNFNELETLEIYGIKSKLNLDAILSCKKIKNLSLHEEESGSSEINLQLLKNCKLLETLDLSSSLCNSICGKILDIDGLKGLNNLKSISIGGINFSGLDNKIFIT